MARAYLRLHSSVYCDRLNTRMRLIHITDPHLTSLDAWRPGLKSGKRWLSWLSWQIRRRHRHRPARLNALIAHLEATRPDAWAITGDLCQIGLEQEAREAAAWLKQLAPASRVALVPGNHDIFARDSINSIARHWVKWLQVNPAAAEWPVVRTFDDVVLIGLNSAVVTPIAKATGKLGQTMRERLLRVLKENRGRCRVVLIHPPPLPGSCKPRKALVDASELASVLQAQGPALVLHGHLHRNLEYGMNCDDGSETAVFCTASASAGGSQGAAAARIFDISPVSDGYRVEMRLKALDASTRAHTIDRRAWISGG